MGWGDSNIIFTYVKKQRTSLNHKAHEKIINSSNWTIHLILQPRVQVNSFELFFRQNVCVPILHYLSHLFLKCGVVGTTLGQGQSSVLMSTLVVFVSGVKEIRKTFYTLEDVRVHMKI